MLARTHACTSPPSASRKRGPLSQRLVTRAGSPSSRVTHQPVSSVVCTNRSLSIYYCAGGTPLVPNFSGGMRGKRVWKQTNVAPSSLSWRKRDKFWSLTNMTEILQTWVQNFVKIDPRGLKHTLTNGHFSLSLSKRVASFAHPITVPTHSRRNIFV